MTSAQGQSDYQQNQAFVDCLQPCDSCDPRQQQSDQQCKSKDSWRVDCSKLIYEALGWRAGGLGLFDRI